MSLYTSPIEQRPVLLDRGFTIPGSTPAADSPADLIIGDLEISRRPPVCRRQGDVLAIPPQAFRLLLLLADSEGQTATRQEIKAEIWGEDAFGDHEKGINFLVHQLRSILDDQPASPTYIETVPRYGYRLIPAVAQETPTGRPWGKASAAVLAAGLLLCVGWLAVIGADRPEAHTERVQPELSGDLLKAYSAGQYQLTRYRELEAEVWPDLDLLRQARERLELVVEAEPEYAPGHTTLAEVLLLLGDGEACGDALRKSLALDPEAKPTLINAAKFNFYYARRFETALRQVDRAIEGTDPTTEDPEDRSNSLLLRARILTAMGRQRESRLTTLEGLELSARSPGFVREASRLAFHGSNFEEAIRLGREAIDIEPKNGTAWRSVLDSYEQMGREMSAVAAINEYLEAWGHGPSAVQSLRDFRLLDLEKRTWSQVESNNLAHRGLIFLSLGDLDEAFALLLEGCRQGGVGELPYLRVDPRLASFRQDPRYPTLEHCVFETIPAVGAP